MSHTILLIEDNEQNLYLTTFLLEQHGFTVVPARSGPEGVALAGRVRPDLIILDIQLPEMDGYTVARELRKNPALKDVPVVAVTSYAMVGDRERALESGCSGYIEKPIDPDTFKSEIERHLNARPKVGTRT
jgi:CheY-like chemotaxis protein